MRVIYVLLGMLVAIPAVYLALAAGAEVLQWILSTMFVALAIMLLGRASATARWRATRSSRC